MDQTRAAWESASEKHNREYDELLALAASGASVERLEEFPEPFWRMGGVSAAAWGGRLPNAFALVARAGGRTGGN